MPETNIEKFEAYYKRIVHEHLSGNDSEFKQYLIEYLRIKKQSNFPNYGVEAAALKVLEKDVYKFFTTVLPLKEDKLIIVLKVVLISFLHLKGQDIKSLNELFGFELERVYPNVKVATKFFIFESELAAIKEYELQLENIEFVKNQISELNIKLKKDVDDVELKILAEKKLFKNNIYTLLIGRRIEKKITKVSNVFKIKQIISKDNLDYLRKNKYNLFTFVYDRFDQDTINEFNIIYHDYLLKKKPLKREIENIKCKYTPFETEFKARLEHLEIRAKINFHI